MALKNTGFKEIEGRTRTSEISYLYEIVRNKIPGCLTVLKFGNNPGVGTSRETIWSGGGLYPYLSSAEVLKVSSDNVNDASPSGSGACTIDIYGLDSTYNEQSESITLNGTVSVSTLNQYIRVFRGIIRSAGSSGWNEGNILVKDNAEAVTLLQIPPQANQTLMAIWTVPSLCTAYMVYWYANTNSRQETEVTLRIRPFGEVFQSKRFIRIYEGTDGREFKLPLSVTSKSDIEVVAVADVGTANVAAGFDLWYEQN